MGETVNNIDYDTDNDFTYGMNGDELNRETENLNLYFTFSIRNDFFGISVELIREVLKYSRVFKIPRVPEYIKGVINLRGEVVPVIDLSGRFYGIESQIKEGTSIIIVEITDNDEKIPVGVMIDSVSAVAELADDEIESVPETGNRIRADYIEGIGKIDGEFAILLNIENVLKIDELSDFN
ncbi:MAG TPA: chemotaxis protein CheW [Spirochaetota bacterium]|nr:chemotaxis protein CheW [Spirochaetota bacterium]HPJ34360.1 chemotaxis protein CheW [Spirochaetota bacterium]